MNTKNQAGVTDDNQNEANYIVVFRGQLLDGEVPTKVATRLKNELRMPERAVGAFLSDKKFIVRRDLSRKKAIQVRAKLRNAGLDVVANQPKLRQPSLSTTAKKVSSSTPKQLNQGLLQPEANTPNPKDPSSKDSSRWIIAGIGVLFAGAVVWLFFSV